jgi:hypothetical protein
MTFIMTDVPSNQGRPGSGGQGVKGAAGGVTMLDVPTNGEPGSRGQGIKGTAGGVKKPLTVLDTGKSQKHVHPQRLVAEAYL